MKFDELDARMRGFEDTLDARLPSGDWVVARLDGRGFSKLTRERHEFRKPFDERFRNLMLETSRVVATEFNAMFVHTHSDEMSFLLARPEAGWPFEGKARKYLSLMAASASVAFSLALKAPASFDCRLIALPNEEDVTDYFRWRMADSERNALGAHAYWQARAGGHSARLATRLLDSLSPEAKVQRLQSLGLNYSALPLWHKRGAGLFWRHEEITGRDPRTGIEAPATRRRRRVELEMPEREEYAALILGILRQAEASLSP